MSQDDYSLVLNGTLSLDFSHRCKWKITGQDRVRYLNGQTTADISRLSVGQSLWTAVPNPKGKLIGDLHIAAAADAFYVDLEPGLADTLLQRLSKYIISDDVLIEDLSQSWSLVHTLTPASGDFCFTSKRLGLSAYDLWLPAGASLPPLNTDSSVTETLRIEHGLPRWGVDMNENNLIPELPFEAFGGLSYSKGCYIGQEVIARIKSIGHVNRKLCLLHSPSTPIHPPTLPGTILKVKKLSAR